MSNTTNTFSSLDSGSVDFTLQSLLSVSEMNSSEPFLSVTSGLYGFGERLCCIGCIGGPSRINTANMAYEHFEYLHQPAS
jgi:hypothetical protein